MILVKLIRSLKLILVSTAHLAAALPGVAFSQPLNDSSPSAITLGEQLENLGRIYKDDDNEVLEELWLLGRYHGQYYRSEGSLGEDEGYETRRMRLGAQARMFQNLTLHAQMVSGSDVNPFYNGFTELWAQWAFTPEFTLTVGQQKNRFTHDRNVSSRYLNYLERSALTNMFGADYTPAVTIQGKVDKVNYLTGIFSNATGRNMGEAFTELNSGYSFLAAGYYDLGDSLGVESATFHSSFLHSDSNDNATNLSTFNDGISAALILYEGSGSLITEVTGGVGRAEGNAWGINLQPGFFLTNTLQAVGRYQVAASNDEMGVNPQRRYEAPAGLPKGNLYHASYVGLNYYIAKHRIKFMNGVEYATMSGEDVWTFSSMIRLYFGPHTNGAFPMNRMLHGHFESD